MVFATLLTDVGKGTFTLVLGEAAVINSIQAVGAVVVIVARGTGAMLLDNAGKLTDLRDRAPLALV